MKKFLYIFVPIFAVVVIAIPLIFIGWRKDVVVTFDKKYELIFDNLSDKTIVKDQSVGLPQVSEEYADLFLGWYDAEKNQKIDDLNSITKSTVLEARFSKELSGLYTDGKFAKTWASIKEEYPDAFTENGITGRYNYPYTSCFSKFKGVFVIDDSVESIGVNTFNECNDITSIIIPNSVTSISYHAFFQFGGLTHIVIPNSVMSIGEHCFFECSSLESVTLSENLTEIDAFLFNRCDNLLSVTIPNGVTIIKQNAFEDCTSLENAIIPISVTSIGNYSFKRCVSLTGITIPNSVTSIGDYAFELCVNLESIVIPNSVTSIGNLAFRYCDNLVSVMIDSADIAALNSSNSLLLYNAQTVYVKTGLTVGAYVTDGFEKQDTSDKAGYDKYTKK